MRKFTFSLLVAFSLLIGGNASFAQITTPSCTPAFRDSTLACADGMYVRITGIASAPIDMDDASSCNGAGYEDLTETYGCSLLLGRTYTATMHTGYTEMSCQVWIDFNNDGIFQPSESVGGIVSFGWGDGDGTTALVIPSTVSPGAYRMRIADDWWASIGGVMYEASTSTVSIPPCPTTAIYYGDVRDYTVTLLSSLSTPVLTTTGKTDIFPNPATNELNITMAPGAYTSFAIANSIGQEMVRQPLSATQTTVNIATLPAGLYYVTFRGCNGTSVQKFVKL